MPRQGSMNIAHRAFRYRAFALAFLAVALLSSLSWGACVTCNYGSSACPAGYYSYRPVSQFVCGSENCSGFSCPSSVQNNGSYYTGMHQSEYCSSTGFTWDCSDHYAGRNYMVDCGYDTRCSTQAEADSAYCALNPSAEGCVEEDVPSSCESDYSNCVSMGGVWKKVASTPSECSSECNLCGDKATTNVKNAYADMCCKKGMAPPGEVQQCYTPVQSGPGMSESVFNNKYNEWSCGARTTADGEPIQENQELYQRFCIDGERYEEQLDTNEAPGGSSSSEGSGASSSEDIGHSFGTELEALGGLYGVLDTIRDTLVKRLTPATERIYDCLLMGTGCTGPLQIDWTGMPSDTFAIDSAILKLITPYLDSSVRLDSAQLKALRSLDTNMLKQLRNDTTKIRLDSAILKNDSTTRRVISGAIDDANDTTRKWFKRIADSIGVSTDSLVAHLDSIRKLIPDSILDSISRYQSQSNDYLDSILNAPGKGFSKLDSAIDSSMKYFYRTLGDLPGDNASQIGWMLGYGDTATSSLRDDLNGIKSLLDGFGDLGDSLGGIRGDLDGLINGTGTAPGDTNGDGPYGGYDGESDSVGNSYIRNVGGLLDSALNDTAFDRIFARDSSSSDSMPVLPDIDSLQAVLDSSVVSQRTELEDTMKAAFDSLKDDFMLLNYDSLILAPLGMRVPNTNTCPEHCFSFTIDGGSSQGQSWLGDVGTLTFPLCENLPGFSFDVLYLIRIIGRLFTAVFCIYIGMWFIAGRKN